VTPAEHQQIAELTELQVHRYFDHYLTDVFPKQMDRCFAAHNSDVDAHPEAFGTMRKTKRRVDRVLWMIAGGSAVGGAIFGAAAGKFPAVLRALFG
jgi:hypothetical protein